MKIVGPDGSELPWDGVSAGDLMVRGPWVTCGYFRSDDTPPLADGWFPTGDVAKIDPDGFMQITDRSKDVIKSGGEWISSIDIENVACLHPDVATAVCIAARHPKWDERPLLLIVKKPGRALDSDQLLAFFDGRVAKWWRPDAVVFIDEVPLGATGKVLKNRLREQYQDHYLSAV
jgi:fatty-acyl-CoA synthase